MRDAGIPDPLREQFDELERAVAARDCHHECMVDVSVFGGPVTYRCIYCPFVREFPRGITFAPSPPEAHMKITVEDSPALRAGRHLRAVHIALSRHYGSHDEYVAAYEQALTEGYGTGLGEGSWTWWGELLLNGIESPCSPT